ncbi:hypothetical protein Tco_0965670 [Tanacetum coccineum]
MWKNLLIRIVNVEESSSTNFAPMAFYDSELNKSESDLDSYKKGLASVEEQLAFIRKMKVCFVIRLLFLKEMLHIMNCLFAPPSIDLSNSGLEKFKQPEFEGYGVKVKSWLVQDQTVLALATPGQTATGNPFMAGSLPKTISPMILSQRLNTVNEESQNEWMDSFSYDVQMQKALFDFRGICQTGEGLTEKKMHEYKLNTASVKFVRCGDIFYMEIAMKYSGVHSLFLDGTSNPDNMLVERIIHCEGNVEKDDQLDQIEARIEESYDGMSYNLSI